MALSPEQEIAGFSDNPARPQPATRVLLDEKCAHAGSLCASCLLTGILDLVKQPISVAVIDLLEHGVRQSQAIDLPAPLPRCIVIIEIFVVGFEPTEVVLVQGSFKVVVGTKHDPVLEIGEQLVRAARLAAEFGFASAELYVDVPEPSQQGLDVVEIFRPIAHM